MDRKNYTKSTLDIDFAPQKSRYLAMLSTD